MVILLPVIWLYPSKAIEDGLGERDGKAAKLIVYLSF